MTLRVEIEYCDPVKQQLWFGVNISIQQEFSVLNNIKETFPILHHVSVLIR